MTSRCAALADQRNEPLDGTASRVDAFLLVETPAPWPEKAASAVDAEMTALAERLNAKLLLIKRPDERVGGERRWAVAEPRRGRIRWGEADWTTEPIVLVCTHARHDVCCGVRGRPVAAALAATHPGRVWEASHVGGHRFAGNVVLPLDGTYYGRITASDASDVVARHLAGEVSPDHLRGFSWMAPPAQAVAVELHRRWGPASADDITRADAAEIAPGHWRVEVEGSQTLPSLVTAIVRAEPGESAALSCGADPDPTTHYVIESLDAEAADV